MKRRVLGLILILLFLLGTLGAAGCAEVMEVAVPILEQAVSAAAQEALSESGAGQTQLPALPTVPPAQEEQAQEAVGEAEPFAGDEQGPPESGAEWIPDADGSYTTAEDVARYLIVYGRLPDNFISKKEARELGWDGGSLESFAPGMCIGGDYFGNYEGLLPKKKGRTYTECDIDTLGARSRGSKRLVFSNDGLIYYTDDHYESFILLYGEE